MDQLRRNAPCVPTSPRPCAFDVVALAGSAGSVQALRQLLAMLPADFPASVLVQTHLSPTYRSVLVDVVQRRSRLPVAWATQGARLQGGTVLIAPPGQHVRVSAAGALDLTSWVELNYRKPQADDLLTSVAASYGPRAIGVIVTGYLNDGAQGVRAIHAAGGRVLVQDPFTAEAEDMPRAALATGCVDFALPLATLAHAIATLVMVPGAAQFFAVPQSAAAQPYREALRLWG